jgi:hypothetical protein
MFGSTIAGLLEPGQEVQSPDAEMRWELLEVATYFGIAHAIIGPARMTEWPPAFERPKSRSRARSTSGGLSRVNTVSTWSGRGAGRPFLSSTRLFGDAGCGLAARSTAATLSTATPRTPPHLDDRKRASS